MALAATFQVLDSLTWLVVTLLGSTDTKHLHSHATFQL